MANNQYNFEDLYTHNEDIDEFCDKDEATEFIGYIDEVHAPAVVGSKMKYDLFKFIVNNGNNRRAVCLVWGRTMIDKCVGEITVGRIVHIEGAQTKAVPMNFFKEAHHFIPFELLIREGTAIHFLGNHNAIGQIRNENVVQPTTFEDVGKTAGLISLEGHIKMKFFKTENKFKAEVYGCGAITDGTYKVNVRVSNYTQMDLEKGVRVRVVGEVDLSGSGPVTIICRDQNSVIAIDGEAMPPQQVAHGVKTPKRGHS